MNSPFNWYLLFISIPDFLAAFFCFWTCVLSIQKGEYFGEAMCGFQSFYLTWAFTSNTWLNARIVYEIHKLLRFSNIRKRYVPPTKKDVKIQAAGVYLYSLFWAILAGFNFKGFPMESGNHRGFACYPIDTEGSVWFTLGVYMPLTILIPSFYAVVAMLHIWKRKLLPPAGRRRRIALFLIRVIVVYLGVWGPFLVVYFLLYAIDLNPWYQFSISMLSHLQGMITSILCYNTDDDLKASMKRVMRCRCRSDNGSSQERLPPFTLSARFSRRFSKRISSMRTRMTNSEQSGPLEVPMDSRRNRSASFTEKYSAVSSMPSMRETEDPEAPLEDDSDDDSLQQALDEEQERWDREKLEEESRLSETLKRKQEEGEGEVESC